MIRSTLLSTILLAVTVRGQVAVYGQCGGINYTGSTVCASGSVCTYQNAYYSQCIPGTATTTATTTKTTTSATTTTTYATVTGYVKTSGTSFTLNGSPFTLVGENAYWIPQYTATADLNQAFADIAGMGATTVRTW
ncbi:hypothetical protein FRB95_005618 [Tulasnella sp. JGI-2019a]|nr:hypothetical protein FRB95_005618 [Tulasnella sp. JGI-2019a]